MEKCNTNISNNETANEIELKDLLGRVVLQQEVLHNERNKLLNIGSLKIGFYMLTVKSDKGIAVRKLLSSNYNRF